MGADEADKGNGAHKDHRFGRHPAQLDKGKERQRSQKRKHESIDRDQRPGSAKSQDGR
ncbi:hypothetical protein ROBYS_37860 [Roseobacter sp. OBYS 0001]|nr:hypothetical protein ROBYS_37860 [Roseobacter sp. OBYS 0001]